MIKIKNLIKFKILLLFIFLFISCSDVFAELSFCGIGANLFQDPYNKKVFAFKPFPNSVALEYGIPAGSQIIKIDNKKIKNMNLHQVGNLLQGSEGSTVKVVIRYKKQLTTYILPRRPFVVPDKISTHFDFYWYQVAPKNVITEPIPENILNNLSRKRYNEILLSSNYWTSRKSEFKKSYDSCLLSSKSMLNYCLSNLVKNENNKTDLDKKAGKVYYLK